MTFWPISSRLSATLAKSHTVVAKAEILYDGAVVAVVSPEGNTGVTSRVRLVNGSVTVERATVRRSGSVTFLDPDNELAEVIQPLRGEVRPYRGAIFADATATERANPPTDREYAPLATLVVAKPHSGVYPQRTVEGKDRLWYVSTQKFVVPWKIPPTTTIAKAIIGVLSAKLPATRRDFDIPETGATTGGLTSLILDEDSDPAEAAANMAATAGLVLYADPMGAIVGRAERDPDPAEAVLTLTPGAGSVMLRPVVERDLSDVSNAVIVTGESTELITPVRGYAEDSDPRSLTYAKAVGQINAIRFSSPVLLTNEQCQQAALTILRSRLGVADTIAQGIITNPALDAGDVLNIADPDQGLDTTVTVDSFSVTLTAATMDLACRTRTVTA